MQKNTLLVVSIVIGFGVFLSSCSPNISGLQEGRANCLSYGYQSGTENYTKCMFIEDERRAEKKKKAQMNKYRAESLD